MRRNPLTIDRLRMLAEVDRTGTIAGAARVMGVTASAVSQQLSALERDAEVGLLDRAGRQVTLTAAGRALVDHAGRVAGALEAAASDLDRLRGAVGGPFHIAAVTSASMSIVSRAVADLGVRHPELDVVVDDEEPRRSLERLVRGDVDLAVVDEYDHAPHPRPDDVVVTELLVEPLVVVTPKGWRRTRGRGVRLADLAGEHWVLAPDTAACGDAVRGACRALGFEPDVRWQTDDILAHLEHVAAGHGVAVLPRLAIRDGVADVDIHVLTEPPLTRRLLAATRATAIQRPTVAAVLAALETAVHA
jgi:DNA-binding transcriptional LysR family regulator